MTKETRRAKVVMLLLLTLTLYFNLASGVRLVEVTNSLCSPVRECVTLVECFSNIRKCLASNSKIDFVDSFYEITGFPSKYFVISDATDLTISGNRSKLACSTESIGFAFINVTNLLFYGLHFDGCWEILPEFVLSQLNLISSDNSAFYMSRGTRVALLLGNINQLVLDNIEIHNSYGYGVVVVDSMWVEIDHSNFSSNNWRALQCFDPAIDAVNMSCCHGLSHIANEGNCIGGNIMVINTERAIYAMNTRTEILNTWITHGVNLDTQQVFNENYTYTAGGLSLYSDHSQYDEAILISHCTIASNIGHNSGNAVVYIHDNINSDYGIKIAHTDFLNGNTGFERFKKTAKSGGLTIFYGYTNEHNHYPGDFANKNIFILHSSFVGNTAFTAGAILFHSYIRDKYAKACFRIINCTISNNFGYDTIVTVRGNMGNRFHDIQFNMMNIHILDNKIVRKVSPFDPLLAYHHTPHISTLHTEGFGIVICVGIVIQGNEFRGISTRHNMEFRFLEENIISDNRGTEGGAIYVDQSEIILESPEPRLYVTNNTATLSGGAFYVVPPPSSLLIPRSPFCFFNIWYGQCSLHSPGRILLRNNSARIAGHSIYGGNIEECNILNCFSPPTDYLRGILAFSVLFDIPWNSSLTEVTSDIERICFCISGKPECGSEPWSMSTYPGGHFRIPTVAIGQLNGTNPGILLSTVVGSDTALINEQQKRQQVGVECHYLNYTIYSMENEQFEIVLSVVDGNANRTILVNATVCPYGFQLQQSLECSCMPIFKKHQVVCFIETQNFKVPAEVWVGFDAETDEFLAHSKCPFHKCSSEIYIFSLNSTDSICSKGFSGILCGGCVSSFSATFGEIGCEKCPAAFSVLVIAIFVFAGPLLVAVMLYGELTVDHGTFNGIIFFANVIQIYRSSFFAPGQINVVTVLIAWLNLDLGIQICFYPGMTFYAQMWFQYLFPVYTILLALTLSILNWYTTLGGKMIGNNICNVSGTLILLSYTKLLRLVAETLSFTSVASSQNSQHRVWLYDGNIRYMEPKHAVLIAASLVTLLLFLIPFTLLMLLEYPLLRQRTRGIMIKCGAYSLTCVYQKPYKELQRWWTGMMLLVRVLLVALHQLGIAGNQELNLIVIVTFGLCILGTMWNMGSLYRNRCVTLLEAFYITNLVLLAGWSVYASSPHSQLILSHILVAAALLTFLATLSYHVITKIMKIAKERKKYTDGQLDITYRQVLEDSDDQPVEPTTHMCINVTGDQKPLTDILEHSN